MKVEDLWGDTASDLFANLILKWGLKKFCVDWIQLFLYNFQLLDFMNTETDLPVSWKFPINTI